MKIGRILFAVVALAVLASAVVVPAEARHHRRHHHRHPHR